jgi:hypothetical protein
MLKDLDTSAVMSVYYQVACRQGKDWAFIHGEVFHNHYNLPRFSIEDTFAGFGTSLTLVAREFFRILSCSNILYTLSSENI